MAITEKIITKWTDDYSNNSVLATYEDGKLIRLILLQDSFNKHHFKSGGLWHYSIDIPEENLLQVIGETSIEQ